MESILSLLKMPLKWILPILNPILKALPESNYFFQCLDGKYADFSTRARRSEYWYYLLANVVYSIIAYIALMIVAFVLGFILGLVKLGVVAGIIVVLLYILLNIPLLIPSLAVTVRRLHDTGKSGWFILISLIPLVGSIILLVFLIQEGTPGSNSNQYGSNPKEV